MYVMMMVLMMTIVRVRMTGITYNSDDGDYNGKNINNYLSNDIIIMIIIIIIIII